MRGLLIISLLLGFMSSASAKLFDLDQAANLMQVLDDVYDASLDTNNYFDLTEDTDSQRSDYQCKRVSNKEVFNRVVGSFQILVDVYPDEDFPIEKAKAELQLILGSSPYYHCPLVVHEGFDDIKYKDLYISMGSGISFIVESSFY